MKNTAGFPEGIRVFKPRENAPSFVKANIVIKKSEFIEWLKNQESESIKIEILQSNKAEMNYYCKVNSWKKEDNFVEKKTDKEYPQRDYSPF